MPRGVWDAVIQLTNGKEYQIFLFYYFCKH
uniref:Uncharacterized protein n=1 Tax=Arundo donax TaxID=35708 RepID=A0A0A9CHW6_ARUDO